MRPMARGALVLAVFLLGAGDSGTFPPGAAAETPPAPPSPASPTPELRLPPDRIYDPGPGGPPPVTFSHARHVDLTGRNCLVCHPAVFKLVHPVGRTTHEEMDAGKSCGTCHNGRDASSTSAGESCGNCHVEATVEQPAVAAMGEKKAAVPAAREGSPGASPTAPAGARDIVLATGEGSPGPVTFRHSRHAGAKCARCHPALFPMKASGKVLDYAAMQQGGTCGACHNRREAFGVDDSDACEKCHATEGGKP